MTNAGLAYKPATALRAVLSAAGYNLRWLLRAIVRLGLGPVFFLLAWV